MNRITRQLFALFATLATLCASALINNFNDLANPDPGAHQSGTPPMVFGTKACFPYYSACRP